ncbi:hypothetical protein PR048_011142 [Dryococelus australis]|uniref:Transposase n=1 Tax=Dryococelus australis TaxID=614101 RepID=A0ABQ9HLH0_9NEOP|nr:hypothetical protein PR048_011142 [Dryococelus australis]
MIALDFQPYSIVEDQGFRSLIATLEPKYVLPSRKQFPAKIIPELYRKECSVKVFLVTDNARNISAAFHEKPVTHLTCAAHTLQLVINDAVRENNVEPVLKKCKVLVGHYRHSTSAREQLQACKVRLNLRTHKLKQMVETRWNSVSNA